MGRANETRVSRRLATNAFAAITLVVAAAATTSTAAADFEVAAPNRAKVTSSLESEAEAQSYLVVLPAGARLTVKASAAKRGPALDVALLDPEGGSPKHAQGKKPSIRNFVAPTSGTYAVRVAASDGVATGGYTMSIAWKSRASYVSEVNVAPGGRGEVAFSAESGGSATFSVKRSKRSAAAPTLSELLLPDGTTTPFSSGASASLPIGASGDFALRFDGGAAGGAVLATVRLKPPRVPKTTLRLDAGAVASGASVLASKLIGPPGGLVSIDEGPLAGTSLQVTAGAIGFPTAFLIGTAPGVAGGGTAGGPAVFFGPEGLTFPAGKSVTITIPYDPAAFADGTSKLRVYTRDAAGAVTLVPSPEIDTVNHVIRFPASHFSVFQALREFRFAETQRITGPTAQAGESFAGSLAIDGDVAAFSLIRRRIDQNPAVVDVFRRSGATWNYEASLSVPDRSQFTSFQGEVSVSGDRILVASPIMRDASGVRTGAAFVFLRDLAGQWAQETELLPPNGASGDYFGGGVAIAGDTAIVAARFESDVASRAGAVHVFVRNGTSQLWELRQTLRAAAPLADDDFGAAIALSGDTLVVGSPGYGASGGVHVFRRSAGVWAEAATVIEPPDPAESAQFGSSVALDGTTIVVGIVPPEAEDVTRGGVRIHEDQGTAFPEVARFVSADVNLPGESVNSEFGYALAVRGDTLLVGAPSHSLVFPGSTEPALYRVGNVFAFQRAGGTWRYAARVRGTASDAYSSVDSSFYGGTLALDGTTGLISSLADATDPTGSGAAYVLDVSGN